MVTIATYARISRDSDGRAEGTEQQRVNAAAYVERNWPGASIRHFVDNDLSAANPNTIRPGYTELLDEIRRGGIDGLVVAEQSRLTRQPSEWEAAIVVLSRAGIDQLHCYRGSPVPVKDSRLVGRILAAVDAEEAERTRTRVTERLERLAAEGRPPGGPSYGYHRTTDDNGQRALVVNETEAPIIREMVDRLLTGWSLTAIARDLTGRGVPTAQGGQWAATTVRSCVSRATIAGLRIHRGEIVGPGNWEPIIPEDRWRQVQALLAGPVEVRRPDGSIYRSKRPRTRTPRRYLLTGGISKCGKCGTALVAQQRRSRAGGRQPSYMCPPAKGGCAGIGILADGLEAHVADRLLEKLAAPDFLAGLTEDSSHDRQAIIDDLGAVEERSADLARQWAAGGLSTVEWSSARDVLTAEKDRLTGLLAELPPPTVDVDPAELVEAWEVMLLGERRKVIEAFIADVTVNPAKPGTRRFDPDRVVISWRAR